VARHREADWAEAKRLCRLSKEEVRMARAMGMNPRKLIKNRPSPSQQWKAPVGEWVRELHRKRFGEPPAERPWPAPALPAAKELDPDELSGAAGGDESWIEAGGDDYWGEPERSLEEEAEEEDRLLLGRQEELRAAADYVAAAFAQLPVVERVVLIGSVARPLEREVPRFARLRRAGVALWHECKDVDLALWVTDVRDLNALQKARGHALNELFADTGFGVAHHQVDVFLLEPVSDRYLGRLCHFGACPKGKPECRVPGCGSAPFLRQHEQFAFDSRSLDPARSHLLFDRTRGLGPPSLRRWDDDTPF
jgi:hypothetical protein